MPTPLEIALRTNPKARKARRPRAAVNLSLPRSFERRYRDLLLTILESDAKAVAQILVPALPSLVAENAALNSTDRLDQTLADRLASLIATTRASMEGDIPDAEIERLAQIMGTQVSEWNRAQIQKAFVAVLGINLFADEPYLQKEIENFAKENVALIGQVRQEFLVQTQRTVFEGFRRGLRHEEIAQNILSSSGDDLGRVSRLAAAENRAALIARDQMNKLNGNLMQLRQTAAGIDRYIWRTVGDDRVRPAHQELNGKEFTWDDPPDEGHPGEPINCRCYAEPVFDL